MAVFVFDPDHPLPPAQGDGETALKIGDGDSVVLAEGAEITASALGILGGSNTHLSIDGRVHSTWDTAILVSGNINIGATGSADGFNFGVEFGLAATPSILTNAGSIYGVVAGVFTNGSAVINNSGVIGGEVGIEANSAAGTALTINNTGVIEAHHSGLAITGSYYGSNIIINSGKVDGGILLGVNADLYDGRGGSVLNGRAIHLNGGNDIVFGGDGAEKIFADRGDLFIDGGGGEDTLVFSIQSPLTVDLRVTGKQAVSEGCSAVIKNIEILGGGGGRDQLAGNDVANTLSGGFGDDSLNGRGGNDLLIGGQGDDAISGGNGVDIAKYSGNFADYTISRGADGSYTILDHRTGATDGSDSLSSIEFLEFADRTIALASATNSAPTSLDLDHASIEASAAPGTLVGHLSGVDLDGDALGYFLVTNPGGHFRIHGDQLLVDKAFASGDRSFDIVVRASDPKGASLDRHFAVSITGNDAAVSQIANPPSPSHLRGGKKADILVGAAGDDRLDGGLGSDRLTGGGGRDVFAFSSKLGKSNVDRILDFTPGDDTMVLSSKIFSHIGSGTLTKDAFHVGARAADLEDRIIYNAKTGALLYDRDGSGSEYAAVMFAQLTPKTVLSAHDFMIG